ncbi:hypothetical protein BJY16_005863 [Actinoplanes octamycinicus]|uniref:Uncharacterized protein n=1 Tax=Actinoplanes octamycinicus TaxID=135948 RepID=A0A7W7H1V2_9ACTN|nr:hypothetical protein [Actinoplanes octamycinicus]MBB4742404.1 hypothetical protein [Actinoplanes octamycinicus]GIE62346.1 hypothetical protein Aoc01nite_77480 [Actinoplanes octamycinicus]
MAAVLRRVTAAAATVVATLALTSTPVKATPDGRNYVYNGSSLGLGVMHLFDGHYGSGKYDQVLPAYQRSDVRFPTWSTTEGVYIGPGYCAQISVRWNANLEWNRNPDIRGPIQLYTDPGYYWKVVQYKARSASSCV